MAPGAGALVEVGGQPLVDLLAGHRLELGPHGPVDRLVSAEGRRVLGAPPVELGPALAPVAPVPLADDRGDPTVGRRLVLAAQRELPADLGLELDVADAPGLGLDVQGAARAGGEAGAVEEDAGAVDQPGAEVAVGQLLDHALAALGVELPDVGTEGLRHGLDLVGVLLAR